MKPETTREIAPGAPLPSRPVDAERHAWVWPALALLAAAVVMRGVFSLSKIYYIRDLNAAFWPMHLWARRTIFDGQSLLWDPYVGCGQSAIADPVRQILFPPAILLRLLFPDVLGYNLAVGLPYFAAAGGAYLLFRRAASRQGAALGAIVYAASGSAMSFGNFINMSWSMASIPWALWATERVLERPTPRRGAALSLVFGLQILAGEPVSLAGTIALVGCYALAGGVAGRSLARRERLVALATVAAAGALGLMLAAAQLLPLAEAASHSIRTTGALVLDPAEWSLHPLTLVELVAPGFFGDYMRTGLAGAPWLAALNTGSGPFIFSIFVGVGALVIAVLGALGGANRGWSRFWAFALAAGLFLALGYNNPLYARLMPLLPFARAFRYPSKFTIFVAISLAALVPAGWDALMRADGAARRPVRVAAGLAFAVAALAAFALAAAWVAPEGAATAGRSLARAVGTKDVEAAAAFLVAAVRSSAPRLVALAAASGALVLLAASRRAEAGLGRAALFALLAVDIVSANANLNPMLNASVFREPAWVAATRANAGDRVYVAGKLPLVVAGRPVPDQLPGDLAVPEDVSFIAARESYAANFGFFPSAWHVREAVSFDFTSLWPADYSLTLTKMATKDRDARARFLNRVGVRYFVLPEPPAGPSRLVEPLPRLAPLAVYEGAPPAPRAALVPDATVEPNVGRQIDRLFAADFDPARELLVAAEPPEPAGQPAALGAEGPGADVVRDDATDVVVAARVPAEGAYLRLLDSYDENWKAEVDGRPAHLLRADGLFRAVRLAPGEHTVRFRYVPRAFYVGLVLSAIAAACLAAASLLGGRARDGGVDVP